MEAAPHPENDDVEALVLGDVPKDEDSLENTKVLEVHINVFEKYRNDDEWRKLFLEYLTSKVLPGDPKLRTNIQK